MPVALSPAPTRLTTIGPADVVFTFSYMSWRAAERRGFSFPEDRLVHSLLADERVGRLIVGDTLRSLPAKLLREGIRRGGGTFPHDPHLRLVSPTCLGASTPSSVPSVARKVAIYERALANAARRMGMHRPVVITGNPLVAGFGNFEWARGVTYYGFDDWSRSPLYRRWWPVYEASYERIRERRLRVAAVSPGLRGELAPAERSVLVKNGLEPTEWAGDPVRPAVIARTRGPVLLYMGTLDYRLRMDWLSDLARALPDATVLLVGPGPQGSGLDELRALPNVVVHPAIEHRDEYAQVVRHADVGLIPHHRTPLTDTIEPQKVWEYLAGGLPVVSADLPPVRNIDPMVSLVPDDGDFTAAVRMALAGERVAESERLAFVNANSWRARHDQLIGLALA